MSKSKIFKILIVLFLFVITAIAIRSLITIPKNIEIKVDEIRYGYKGIIIKKYAPRNTKATHLLIYTTDNRKIEVSPNSQLVHAANTGDSIIKPENENIAYLKKKDGYTKKYFYTRISFETRKSKYFPQKWRDKWMESSQWDEKKQ